MTQAHIIVFGNEKGGSGKSTTAMHTAIALLRLGYTVGTIDLDARQGTLTRYMKNRFDYMRSAQKPILSPAHMAINKSRAETVSEQQDEERDFFMMALEELGSAADFIVVDTPGTDNFLSRLAHSYADTLVTPMNDSFIDLDLLARIDPNSHDILSPSVYSSMVNAQRDTKLERDGTRMDWIVVRNRLAHIEANNKKIIGELLEKISRLAGFRTVPGFGERVVFKELFLKGLTLMDLKDESKDNLTLSEIAARQEVRQLITAIGPERLKGPVKPRHAMKAASEQTLDPAQSPDQEKIQNAQS
ncbi:MAG: AAA family ATPase [Alphaproteobacteria bacterium]|nr:AAA family ATPase [Alphaproteobacteria bacterium]